MFCRKMAEFSGGRSVTCSLEWNWRFMNIHSNITILFFLVAKLCDWQPKFWHVCISQPGLSYVHPEPDSRADFPDIECAEHNYCKIETLVSKLSAEHPLPSWRLLSCATFWCKLGANNRAKYKHFSVFRFKEFKFLIKYTEWFQFSLTPRIL